MCKLTFVLAVLLIAVPLARGDEPPPEPCQGGEPYQFEVQVSMDGGQSWQSNRIPILAYPGTQVDVAVRTRMTVTTGQTQGWSFSIKHDPSSLHPFMGDMNVTGVTAEGTDTATVQNGNPPDGEYTEIQLGFEGYTQGVVIDTYQEVTLPPTTNFVSSLACYRIDVPWYSGYYAIPIMFTHDIGDPPIDSIVTQDGLGIPPCARNMEIQMYVGAFSQDYPPCVIQAGRESGPVLSGIDEDPCPPASTANEEGGAGGKAPKDRLKYDCSDCVAGTAILVPDDKATIEEAVAEAKLQGKDLICVSTFYLGTENPMVITIDLTILGYELDPQQQPGCPPQPIPVQRTPGLPDPDLPLVHVDGVSFRMRDFKFTGLAPSFEGSFIDADYSATTTADFEFILEACTFQAYRTTQEFGRPRAVRISGPGPDDPGPTVRLFNCQFNNIHDGGGLRIGGASDSEDENEQTFAGRYQSVDLAECSFQGSSRGGRDITPPDYGGGALIALSGQGSLSITDTEFTGCYAGEFAATGARGGGLCLFFDNANCPATLTECHFETCFGDAGPALNQGGGLCVLGANSTVTITDSTFEDNGATTDPNEGYEGNGLYMDLVKPAGLTQTSVQLTGVRFRLNGHPHNPSSLGGGAFLKTHVDLSYTLCECLFEECGDTDIPNSRGGGLYIDSSVAAAEAVQIKKTQFLSNQAGASGAGLFLNGPRSIFLETTLFGENIAQEGGGGIACQNLTQDKQVTISACSFRNNAGTGQQGDAIAVLAQQGPGSFVIGNSIIYQHDNPILYAPQPLDAFPARYAKRNCLEECPPGWECAPWDPADPPRNLLNDPQFASAAGYKIQPGSVCVNHAYRSDDGEVTGPPNLPAPPAYDMDGTQRVYLVDIGAHEPLLKKRFVRGEANVDDRYNLADAVKILQHLFLGDKLVYCLDALDANDDADSNIADAVWILQHLFINGPPPPPPFPGLGEDPTPDSTDCDCYPQADCDTFL